MTPKSLIAHVRSARENAHAPYSGFRVGAAARSVSGRIHAGCNVENVSYPEGTCAETGAIAAMVASGEKELVEIAIMTDSARPTPPCGGCRQRLAEFGHGTTRIIMATPAGEWQESTLAELLPENFNRKLPGQ